MAILDFPYPLGRESDMIALGKGSRRRSPMIEIYLPYVYSLSEALEPLSTLARGAKFMDSFHMLYTAQTQLETFLNGSVFASSLRSCRGHGGNLIASINAVTSNIDDLDREIQFSEVYTITSQAAQFKTAMLAELGVFPTYFVTQKESFDTLTLLNHGETLFPSELKEKVPEAVFDVKQAGKALAYELATAVGFHVFRATESVLRRYYTQTTGGQPLPKVRSIVVYVRAMRIGNSGDEKILATLEQMAKLHRNPLIHPEVVLTINEAIATAGIARSVVTAMLDALPSLAPTTTTTP